jgi:hypothetical protein
MGLWGFFEDDATKDHDSGTRILSAYFESAKEFPEFQYADADSFIEALNQKLGGEDFALNIGEIVRLNYASTDESTAISRVQNLAQVSRGTANPSQIIGIAATTGSDTINWSAMLPEVAIQTAQDLAEETVEIAQAAGEGILATGKTLKYLPWILGGAAVLALLYYGQPILKMMKK